MITDTIIGALLGAWSALFGLFPSWESAAAYDFDPTSVGFIRAIQVVFPIGTMLLGITLLFGLELAMKSWDLIVWVWHQFWGSD